ncbi:glutamate receptor ionotropic, kainate 4-like [Portunus trituberculatus]|uniref:glutamate receptor ionotropic, kainate 4-like n=1 Tax=Portunus trituberculatus TaxID=210409 RepID=UPI001E1D0C6F|nr:glutamate receptor ionotropic, kainate 4-like [Portunus trituberculatus]
MDCSPAASSPYGHLHSQSKAVIYNWPPFIMLHTEGGKTQLKGVFFELWTILQGRLNFTYEWKRSPDGEWGVVAPDGSWSGMIGQLVRGDADVIVGSVDFTSERARAIDFVVPIVYSSFRLLVRQPTSPIGGWSSYSMEFTAGSWAGLLLTACVCCIVLAIVLRLASGEHYAAREAVLIVIGCLCQQGPVREEKRSSVRIVLLTVGVFGVVSVTHYSSVMISFLTLTTSTHSIASLADLLGSSTYTLGIVRGTSTHDIIQASRGEPYRQVWTELLAPRPDSFVANMDEGVQRADREDFVFLIDENFYLSRYSRHCSLTLVGPRYLKMPSSYTFRKDAPYKLIFDHEITRMMEAGLLDREIRRKQAKATCEKESITPIGFHNTFTALLLLATGVLLSLLLLLIERLAFRCTHQTVGVSPRSRPTPGSPMLGRGAEIVSARGGGK